MDAISATVPAIPRLAADEVAYVLPRQDSAKSLAASSYVPTLTETPYEEKKFEFDSMLPPSAAASMPALVVPELLGGEVDAAAPELSFARKVVLIAMMMWVQFIASANTNAVVVTIPSMSADLGIDQLSAQWVASAYALTFGCGLLFAGRLADLHGRKGLFLLGLGIAVVFSVAAGFVKTLIPLCIVRALVGLGNAIATPAGFGIIGVTFPRDPERTYAFAIFGLGNPLGSAIGMVLGGLMAAINAHGWAYLYFLLAAFGVVPLVLGAFIIPRDVRARTEGENRRIDWLGGFLVTAGLLLFIFSITQSGVAADGWRTPYIPVLLIVGIALLVAFVFWERHVERNLAFPPIAKLSIFSRDHWHMSAIMASGFFTFITIGGFVYLVSLYDQDYRGYSALQTAIHILPASVTGIGAAVAVMYLVPRFKAPRIIMIGAFLSGMTCLLYAVEPTGTIFWAVEFIALLCLPFGADLTVGVGSILVSNLCDEDEQSVGGALFQTSLQIALALGTCVAALVSDTVQAKTGDVLTGFRHAFGQNTAWCWAVVVIVGLSCRHMGLAKDVGHGKAIH
ncbi:hypothetical protein Q5752_000306 [Cryptotrichosporon argae]